LTRDPHLQNLFHHAEKLVQPQIGAFPPETETCKILKAAHAIQLATLIQFLPTTFNQLFEVLVGILIHIYIWNCSIIYLLLGHGSWHFRRRHSSCKIDG